MIKPQAGACPESGVLSREAAQQSAARRPHPLSATHGSASLSQHLRAERQAIPASNMQAAAMQAQACGAYSAQPASRRPCPNTVSPRQVLQAWRLPRCGLLPHPLTEPPHASLPAGCPRQRTPATQVGDWSRVAPRGAGQLAPPAPAAATLSRQPGPAGALPLLPLQGRAWRAADLRHHGKGSGPVQQGLC